MKSTVNVVIMVLGLSVAADSGADAKSTHFPLQTTLFADSSTSLTQHFSHLDTGVKTDRKAIIQPCYRWPHPCD